MFLLGYPGVGKRTVGSHLTELLDGVLVDNALIHLPLLTLFKWDAAHARRANCERRTLLRPELQVGGRHRPGQATWPPTQTAAALTCTESRTTSVALASKPPPFSAFRRRAPQRAGDPTTPLPSVRFHRPSSRA